VALLEKYRTVIYAHFVEQVGEEAAEAMLAQFPSRDLDEPVTKEFVALQIAELRSEMHQELGLLRSEIHRQTERLLNRVQIVAGLSVVALTVVNALVG
jgi:hypothetical protein